MGVESSDNFEKTPLGRYGETCSEDLEMEDKSLKEVVVEIDRKIIEIFPQNDGSFNVYLCGYIFSVSRSKIGKKDLVAVEGTSTTKADPKYVQILIPLVIKAVKDNYFSE